MSEELIGGYGAGRCKWCGRECTGEYCCTDCRNVARDHAPVEAPTPREEPTRQNRRMENSFAMANRLAEPSPEPRTVDGTALHDGAIYDPTSGCPRGRHDCKPLSRIASPAFTSFMCCGETSNAPMPTDRLRLCIKSTHDHGVDVLVNLDERDAVHTCSALIGGLAALGSVSITARGE